AREEQDRALRASGAPGQGGGGGLALAAGGGAVLDADDGGASGDAVEPCAVDGAKPRERDDAEREPVVHEQVGRPPRLREHDGAGHARAGRSEEHTSELQSPYELVCRLRLEKKN